MPAGKGESAYWFCVHGMRNGVHCCIKRETVGRKIKYTLDLVSEQDTECYFEFTTFDYTEKDGVIKMVFKDDAEGMITQKVKC